MSVPTIPLRHAAEVLVSNVDKKSQDGQLAVRLVNYTDVYYNRRITSDMDFMNATATPDQVRRFRVKVGDTLITKDSETASDIAVPSYVERSEPDMICGYHLAMLRPHSMYDPRFFHWAIASEAARGQFSVSANGMTRFGLTYDAIQSVAIPMPPLAEQARIARFLDDQTTRIDQVIEARQKQIELVQSALQSRLASMVVDWERVRPVTRLGRFIDYVEQGGSPSGDDRELDSNEPAVLKTSAIKQGRFVEGQRKALVDARDFDPSYQVRDGDVLVVRGSGSADLVADAAEVRLSTPSRNLMLSDLTYRLAGLRMLPSFAVALLLSPPIRSQIRASVRQGSGPAKVRGEDLCSLAVPVLDSREQSDFSELYWRDRKGSDLAQRRLIATVALLQEFKRSLISAAVSGEFDVTTASGRGVPA